MIPLRLHLQNFLSYGEACDPIDFDGIHVACLCGPNGHGKSALLDGITWSLWGQARSNSADDLIRLGQRSMQVELEFLLDGQRYRVIRKRQSGKTGQSDLQFQILDPNDQWRALTGQGVRGTQERINETLRMDYDTFINSAFILQGRADEFARRTSGERKRILGEILSLGVYDQLAETARARRADAVTQVHALEARLAQTEQEHAQLPQLQEAVERLTAERTEAQLAVERARSELQQVLVEKAKLDAQRAQHDDLARHLSRADADLSSLRGQLAKTQSQLSAAQAILERAAQTRQRAQELAAVTSERDQLTAALSQLNDLQQQQNGLSQKLRDARHALETRAQLARQRARELRQQSDQIPAAEKNLALLEEQSKALDALQEERTRLQERLQELAGGLAAAESDERRCRAELEEADERFRMLKEAHAQCPLCESELPEPKRKTLGWTLKEQRLTLRAAIEASVQRQQELRQADSETRRALSGIEQKLRAGQQLRDRLAQARQKLEQLQEATQALVEAEQMLQALEAEIKAEAFEPELRQSLAELQRRIADLRYDRTQHDRVTRRAAELAGADRDLHLLEQAEQQSPALAEEVRRLETTLKEREAEVAEDRARLAELSRDLARARQVELDAARLEAALKQAEQLEAIASQKLGAATEAVERCASLADVLTQLRRDRDAAAKDQALYEELAKAFSRNGIQALIIENALPEIETEANLLLHRMSEGQLSVRLKTQRETKSGKQSETLDIEISDGMGARKYELYSGGEAFRVNFAIRIALSKMLARRAGARLETLVIDEGFGSQDAEGRQRLVEAIQAVQDDFARILVITHIDELKDQFPTRIEVTKGPLGSQVSIY